MFTQSYLKELFDYRDGQLIWKVKKSKNTIIGSVAGNISKGRGATSYRKIKIDKKDYQVHRIVWFWHHGKWPKDQIDHIDGNGLNNSLENLREATPKENQLNVPIPKNNTSGVKGVCWNKSAKKWTARINLHKKQICLGNFDDIVTATIVRKEAEIKYFGEWARKEPK